MAKQDKESVMNALAMKVASSLIRFFNMSRLGSEIKSASSLQADQHVGDVEAYEFLLGSKLVADERVWVRRRCTTIARRHIETASWKSKDRWMLESRALVRFFESSKDKDVQFAKSILMPYDIRYNLARASTPISTV